MLPQLPLPKYNLGQSNLERFFIKSLCLRRDNRGWGIIYQLTRLAWDSLGWIRSGRVGLGYCFDIYQLTRLAWDILGWIRSGRVGSGCVGLEAAHGWPEMGGSGWVKCANLTLVRLAD